MKNHLILHLLTLPLITLLIPVPVGAADAEFCTDYVLVAISQYWRSVDAGCGFSGPRWNSDYKGQYEWCLSAHQWVAENETETRDRLLAECLAERSAPKEAEKNNKTKETLPADNADTTTLISTKTARETKKPVSKNSEKNALNKQLIEAVARNDIDKLLQLYEAGADLEYVTDDTELIKKYGMTYHLGQGVDIKGSGNVSVSGNTVNGIPQKTRPVSESLLSYAVSNGLVDAGLWLLQHSKKTISEQQRKQLKKKLLGNALIKAVKEKDSQSVKALLEKGAPVNYELEMNFGTPLYFAVQEKSIPLAKILLEHGANVNYTTNGGASMLNSVLDNVELLRLLLDHGADPDSAGETGDMVNYPLLQAIQGGHKKAVDLLLSKGANKEISSYDVPYPLHLATRNKQTAIVEALLNYGANPNIVYNTVSPGKCVEGVDNITALDEAVKVGDTRIITLLKRAGAKSGQEICNQETGK